MRILHVESFLDHNEDSRDILDTMIQQNKINTTEDDPKPKKR